MLNGVFVASVTPFTKRGDLDLPALRALLEWQAKSGVHGFVPCGTTGENPTLSKSEWTQVVQLTIEVAKKHGKKVVAGCGSNNTAEVLSLIDEAKALGADAALVVTPYYNKPNQRGLIAHYETIAERSPLPIVLYNVPGRTNVSITCETLKQLFKSDKIVAIKEASGNYSQWMQIAAENNLSQKSLLSGDDDAFVAILALGGTGIISAAANVMPGKFVELYDLTLKNEWKKAFELQTALFPAIKALFAETNPAPAKFALSVLGLSENNLRLPLVPVSSETEKAIRSSLGSLGLV